MPFFFTNLRLMEFQVKHLALFRLFSVINGFGCFWIGIIHKNIQLMLEFLKAPFLVLHLPIHFSYYTLMTFLMMLSAILLSMLMILLSFLSVIRHWSVATTRIGFCTWILSMRHWTGAGNGVLISMLEKLNWFCLTNLITLVLLMWKWMVLFLGISINISYGHAWDTVVMPGRCP